MLSGRIDRAVSVDDMARLAQARLPRVVWEYLAGGAEDETLLRENRDAFARIRLSPRVLTGRGRQDLSVTLFGNRYAAPFLIGPTGLNGLFWREGDLALARAATAAGIGFVLSTASNTSLEEVAKRTSGPRWFQLYPWGDPALSARLLHRARIAGYAAAVVTVDSLVAGKRERDLRNRFSHEIRITPRVALDGLRHPRWLASVWLRGGMPRFENVAEFLPAGATATDLAEFTRSQRNPFFSWDDVAHLRDVWRGPLLVKGVLAAADAERAIAVGADGIVISNHGGRQLDVAQATIDALPTIAAAVGGRMTILLDSGIRRGSDIVKALALGADAVLLGRATLYGLAAGGEAGVARVLEILRDETARTLALVGCSEAVEVTAEHVSNIARLEREPPDLKELGSPARRSGRA